MNKSLFSLPLMLLISLVFMPSVFSVPAAWEYFSLDADPNGDNGILTGTAAGGLALLDNCKVGGCYTADTPNEEIALDQIIKYPDNSVFTISYWANQTSSGDMIVMGDADSTNSHIGFHFVTAPNQIRTKTQAGTQYNWALVESVNAWHHYVFIANATQSAYYKDGNIISAQNANNDYWIDDFFNGYTSTTYSFLGGIDEICFWNQSLSSDDISDLYNSGDGVADCGATSTSFSITDEYALNSSVKRVSSFSDDNLIEIEKVVINALFNTGFNVSSIDFNFTMRGLHSCSLGNIQSTTCYNHSQNTWISYVNGTTTSTFKDEGNVGDSIVPSAVWTASGINITLTIDEHYQNVFKHYNADYDFTDVKWQTGASQRITKNNYIKVEVNKTLIPSTADVYKLDVRLNTSTISPTQPVIVHACNSSYTTGDPDVSSECSLVCSLDDEEFQDDGTKSRCIFTSELIDTLGDLQYITFQTDEPATSRYYALKTYKADTAGYTTKWEYSTDSGSSWSNLGDSYETELNINWYTSVTGLNSTFMYVIDVEDTEGTSLQLEDNISWQVDTDRNLPPLVNIINPSVDEVFFEHSFNYTWEYADPNDDVINISLLLYLDSKYNRTIVENITASYYNYTCGDCIGGAYTIDVVATELGTTELFSDTDSHNFTFQEAPSISYIYPTPVDNHTNNTQQIINLSCSPAGSYYLWYASVTPLNDSHLVLDNVSTSSYTTSLSGETTIYYKGACEVSGLISLNTTERNFNYDDTYPMAVGAVDKIIAPNGTLNFSVVFTDNHFFGYNITCPTIQYTSAVTGLDVPSYTANLTFIANATDTCSVHYADGHTAAELTKEWDVLKYSGNDKSDYLKFRIDAKYENSLTIVSHNFSAYIEYNKSKDKISFEMDLKDYPDEALVMHYRTEGKSYYLKNDKYPAWIVDPDSETWFDLDGTKTDIHVFQLQDNLWEITIPNPPKKLKFKSTGELNVVDTSFTVSWITSTQSGTLLQPWTCPAITTPNVLFLTFAFLVLVMIFILNQTMIRFPIVHMLDGIGFMFFGWTLMGCSWFIGFVTAIAGLAIMLGASFILKPSAPTIF